MSSGVHQVVCQMRNGTSSRWPTRGNDGINRENGGDPNVQWQMHRQQQKQQIPDSTGTEANAAEAKAEDIQSRLDAGHAVSAAERGFLNKMQKVIVQNRGDFYGDGAPYIGALVNTGWTDAAGEGVGSGCRWSANAGGECSVGASDHGGDACGWWVSVSGSKNFDESTGRYRNPPAPVVSPPVVPRLTFPGQPSVPSGRRCSIVQPGAGAVRVTPVVPGLPVQAGQTGQMKKKVAAPGHFGVSVYGFTGA